MQSSSLKVYNQMLIRKIHVVLLSMMLMAGVLAGLPPLSSGKLGYTEFIAKPGEEKLPTLRPFASRPKFGAGPSPEDLERIAANARRMRPDLQTRAISPKPLSDPSPVEPFKKRVTAKPSPPFRWRNTGEDEDDDDDPFPSKYQRPKFEAKEGSRQDENKGQKKMTPEKEKALWAKVWGKKPEKTNSDQPKQKKRRHSKHNPKSKNPK